MNVLELWKKTSYTKKIVILLSLVMLLGAGLRLFKLGSNNLWFDEAASVVMKNKISEFPAYRQPPLYYLLLLFWSNCFGESEFTLRFLSLIFSVLSILMIYKLGELSFDKKTGLISAFILSVSPIHIWYAQEVREYSLLCFLVMASVYFFIRTLKENKRCFWVGFILTATLSLFTNYFAFLIILASGLFFLYKEYRISAKKWLISCLAILLLFGPWFNIFIKHLVFTKGVFWIPRPDLKSILLTFENFALGYNATALSYLLGSIAFTILFIACFFYGKKHKDILVFLALFLFVPIIGSFLISQRMSIYIDRQNMAVSPFYYVIVAAGFVAMKNKLASKVLFGIGIVILPMLSLYNYYTNYMPLGYGSGHSVGICPKNDFKKTVNYLQENMREDDAIAYTHPSAEFPIKYYFNYYYPAPAYYFVFYAKEDEYFQKIARLYAENSEYNDNKALKVVDLSQGLDQNNFHRIWLISSSWQRAGQLENNSLAVQEFMEKHYKKLQSREFEGLFVELYEN